MNASLPPQAATPVSVVIGAASGIGAAIAAHLTGAGHLVVRADLNASDDIWSVDVADEQSVERLLTEVVALHGGFTGLVNCAGVSTLSPVVDHDGGEFRRIIDVSLIGAFHALKHGGKLISDGGSMVTLASLNAVQPGTGLAAYCAAKAGVVQLSRVTALELGPRRVRVNTVSPGLVITPLTEPAMQIPGTREAYVENTPLGRPGSTEEIAAAVAYLLSDGAAWTTGEDLQVNGGAHLMRYPDLMDLVTKAFG